MIHHLKPTTLTEQNLTDLEALMHAWGQPAYRARQIYHHLYVNLTPHVDEMTDLPRALRAHLASNARLSSLRLAHLQHAPDQQTHKALFLLHDNRRIETVLMDYAERTTVCVSTQAGCAIGCLFCATGTLGLQRNLTSGEIVDQVVWAARQVRASDAPPLNVVFMGMGEPFANYDAWWNAVQRIHDPQGLNLGARRLTVSTAGLVPGIRRLASATLPINLAISLHAPDDNLRNKLVPINRRYPLDDLLPAVRDYTIATGRRVSFEYVLLHQRNDDPRQARALAERLRATASTSHPLLYHVNLIPWNAVPGSPLRSTDLARMLAFQRTLHEHHIPCTVRVERGGTIAAACGQLAAPPPPALADHPIEQQEEATR